MTPAASAALSAGVPAVPAAAARALTPQALRRPGIHPSVRAGEGERLVVLPPHEVPRGAKVLGVVVALPDLRGRTGAASPGRTGTPLRAVPGDGAGRPAPAPRSRPVEPRDLRPGLVLLRGEKVLLRDGERVELTRREYDLLDHLGSRPRRIVSRSALLLAVWGAAVPMETRTVDVHVLRLRRKLGAGHAQALETVRGIGYRWTP
ncbi:MAG: winged helix-turn-helix domain-containing protein [Kineosporiaceae bacterium]